MKKNVLILALLSVALTFVSCSKKTKLTPVNIQPITYQKDNITIKVDPKLELLMIALRLAEVQPFSDSNYGQEYAQYIEGVDKVFSKLKDHPLVKELKANSKKNKKNKYNEVLRITRYISDDMTQLSVKQKELPESMQDYWKGINLKNFIAYFNDFAVSSNYERVWLLYAPQLKNQAINVQEYFDYNKKVTEWVSSYFFKENTQVEYDLHSTVISGGQPYIISPDYENNKVTIEGIIPAYWTKENEWNAFTSCMLFGFQITYDLLQKHWDLFSADAERIIKQIYTDNQLTDKLTEKDIQTFTAGVLAYAAMFNYDFIKDDEDNYTSLYNAIATQFLIKEPDNVLAIFDHYQNNRSQFPDFNAFVENYLPGALKEF